MNTEEILAQRAKTHGDFNIGADTFADLIMPINARVTNLSNVQHYALVMIAAKMVRILNGNANEPDHWQDIIGYATLGGQLNAGRPKKQATTVYWGDRDTYLDQVFQPSTITK